MVAKFMFCITLMGAGVCGWQHPGDTGMYARDNLDHYNNHLRVRDAVAEDGPELHARDNLDYDDVLLVRDMLADDEEDFRLSKRRVDVGTVVKIGETFYCKFPNGLAYPCNAETRAKAKVGNRCSSILGGPTRCVARSYLYPADLEAIV